MAAAQVKIGAQEKLIGPFAYPLYTRNATHQYFANSGFTVLYNSEFAPEMNKKCKATFSLYKGTVRINYSRDPLSICSKTIRTCVIRTD